MGKLTFVVYRRNTFEITNSVYFAYSLGEAITTKASLAAANPEHEYAIAVEIGD